MRQCRSCAATSSEANFPKARGPGSAICADCAAELNRLADTSPRKIPRSRRSYRAAMRYREQSPQGDLVDLITPKP